MHSTSHLLSDRIVLLSYQYLLVDAARDLANDELFIGDTIAHGNGWGLAERRLRNSVS